MALLIAVEVAHAQSKKSNLKKHRELNKFPWSLNYETVQAEKGPKGRRGLASSL